MGGKASLTHHAYSTLFLPFFLTFLLILLPSLLLHRLLTYHFPFLAISGVLWNQPAPFPGWMSYKGSVLAFSVV